MNNRLTIVVRSLDHPGTLGAAAGLHPILQPFAGLHAPIMAVVRISPVSAIGSERYPVPDARPADR